jgi:D-alanine-D-alanine ligase
MPLTDKHIGVLMGGASAEREVSLKSGAAVLGALKGRGYRASGIDAGADLCEVLRKEKIEIAFIVLHGGHGENGAIQGLLEVLGIPYTGSGVLASALAMDKEATKKIFLHHAIPVAPFAVLGRAKGTAPGFPLPWVVKPATEGSSIGVSIVKDDAAAAAAVDDAFRYGERVVIEKYIRGKEVQVGILGDGVLGAVEVRPKTEFYSYEAKYTAGMTEYILPPEISPTLREDAEKTALLAHQALGCRGATRVDLIIDDENKSYVLEVNTIPGMTETSLLPKIARQSGLDFPALIEAILSEAIHGVVKR